MTVIVTILQLRGGGGGGASKRGGGACEVLPLRKTEKVLAMLKGGDTNIF